jgi:subtilisin family serine protease
MACASASNKPIIIAVIDTGFAYQSRGKGAKLCKYGHKDFSIDKQYTSGWGTKDPIPLDIDGHGTNIVGVIQKQINSDTNYCFVIIKYWSEKQRGFENLMSSQKALRYAANIKADLINYSGGGPDFDETEYAETKRFLDNKGIFVAAAMNDNKNIDLAENHVYPAQYDRRIIVVGNKTKFGNKAKNSNYGRSVTVWEVGVNVEAFGLRMSGTSQATAVATGKIVNMIDR